MLQAFTNSTESTNDSFARRSIANANFIMSVLDDGYLVAMSIGRVKGKTLTWDFAIYGKDANGSKAYVYSDAYTQAAIEFFRTQDLDEQISSGLVGSPMENYQAEMHSKYSLTTPTLERYNRTGQTGQECNYRKALLDK
jgi:hypothetical protein